MTTEFVSVYQFHIIAFLLREFVLISCCVPLGTHTFKGFMKDLEMELS